MFGHRGCRVVVSCGMVVRSCLPMRSCAGEKPLSSGVARYVIKAFSFSPPPFHSPFTVATARSVSPLAWGYLRLLVICVNPYSVEKSLKSSQLYCEPLSDTTVSGIPWRLNTSLRAAMTVLAEAMLRWATSM